MSTKEKINISLVVIGITTLVFAVFAIYPLFNQIKNESANITLQRNNLAGVEDKIANLGKFQAHIEDYQPNLTRINQLFVDAAEPVDFIEFLEKEALESQLLIEISPVSLQKPAEDSWPLINFQLILIGSFPDFLGFLEKLESSPYLIRISNFNIKKAVEFENETTAVLLIEAYSK